LMFDRRRCSTVKKYSVRIILVMDDDYAAYNPIWSTSPLFLQEFPLAP